MTPEFGAASQLEKIDMLDFADVVAINKFERRGAMDALRDVGRQMVRNRGAFGKKPEDMPVFGTSAATFNDDGVTALYQELRGLLGEAGLEVGEGALAPVSVRHSSVLRQVVPPQRVRYLAEIAETVRGYHEDTGRYADAARRVQRLTEVGARARAGRVPTEPVSTRCSPDAQDDLPALGRPPARRVVLGRRGLLGRRAGRHGARQGDPHLARAGVVVRQPDPSGLAARATPTTATSCRSCAARTSPATSRSPPASSRSSGTTRTPPGCSPARGTRSAPTAGSRCSPQGQPATRLSTAFDSVTLYGRDPDKRPDIYGKVGTSGVSVATLDDMRELYAGFDLTSPTTSVSMTINGPAPTILAFFLNTVMDRAVEAWAAEQGREPSAEEADGIRAHGAAGRARHRPGRHPQGGPGPEHLPVLHRVLACG